MCAKHTKCLSLNFYVSKKPPLGVSRSDIRSSPAAVGVFVCELREKFGTATHHRRGSWKVQENIFLSCSFIDFHSCLRFCGSFCAPRRHRRSSCMFSQTRQKYIKVSSRYTLRYDFFVIMVYLAYVCTNLLSITICFPASDFFVCRTAPRAFRFAVKIYHAFSSFETRRRLWRLESVRSFPLNCRVAFRHSVLNFHVRASIVCRYRSLKRPLRKTAPLCTLRVTSQKCSHCFRQLDCCRKRDSNTLLQSSWRNHPAR